MVQEVMKGLEQFLSADWSGAPGAAWVAMGAVGVVGVMGVVVAVRVRRVRVTERKEVEVELGGCRCRGEQQR